MNFQEMLDRMNMVKILPLTDDERKEMSKAAQRTAQRFLRGELSKEELTQKTLQSLAIVIGKTIEDISQLQDPQGKLREFGYMNLDDIKDAYGWALDYYRISY